MVIELLYLLWSIFKLSKDLEFNLMVKCLSIFMYYHNSSLIGQVNMSNFVMGNVIFLFKDVFTKESYQSVSKRIIK